MKTFTSSLSLVIALTLSENVVAFTPNTLMGTQSNFALHAEVATEPTPAAAAIKEQVPSKDSVVKYDTDVNDSGEKWKVKDAAEKIITDPKLRVQTGRYDDIDMSIAMPFLKRPTNLDGTHAGDVGFDPLGLSESNDMYTMMEAEIRHARLAMLAVVGWPLSELNAPQWMLHGKEHLAPSVLNGFDPLSFIATAAILGGFGYFEYQTALRRTDDKALGKKHIEDMKNVWKYGVPGDYNFDPLNLYRSFGDDAAGRKGMRELEIAHGRSAMLGITYFAAWEALTGHPIVENNPFFHPNAALPALGIAYLLFGFFYEIENSDQYLFQVKMTSEGNSRMEQAKMEFKNASEDAEAILSIADKKTAIIRQKVGLAASDLATKYAEITEDYTKSVMSKNYDV